jgi:hypothetical protein
MPVGEWDMGMEWANGMLWRCNICWISGGQYLAFGVDVVTESLGYSSFDKFSAGK